MNTPTNILYVGGPQDGKRGPWPIHAVTQYATVAKLPFRTMADTVAGMTAMPNIQTHTYNLKQFTLRDGRTVYIMLYDRLSDPIEALVKGYRYHRNPRPRYRRSMYAGPWYNKHTGAMLGATRTSGGPGVVGVRQHVRNGGSPQ